MTVLVFVAGLFIGALIGARMLLWGLRATDRRRGHDGDRNVISAGRWRIAHHL